MVTPTSFMFNEQNAATNHFQHHTDASLAVQRAVAQAEFNTAVTTLSTAGIDVLVHTDSSEPPKPDAVFPNNWFTTWPDGRLITYPMAAPNRRLERDTGVIDELRQRYDISEVIDISAHEQAGRFLEATGAMVFDHTNKVVYGCISPRCDEGLFREHAAYLGYEPVAFHAYGSDGAPIYHTNVLMGVQQQTAVICLEDISDPQERNRVETSLSSGGRTVIDISHDQLQAFCGNILELANAQGEALLVMSGHAHEAFTKPQLDILSQHMRLVVIAVPTIELIGGGGIRCMLGEIFLPVRT
jgi:hypothetical protein